MSMAQAAAVSKYFAPPEAPVESGEIESGGIGSGEIRPRAPRPMPGGAALYELPRVSDPRGHLSFAELHGNLPFEVLRYFVVFGVPHREIRGEHAHRTLHQFLVCVHGSCSVRLYDGERSDEMLLDRADVALYVPPMVWTTQYEYSPDAVLLVLASDVYREQDYIRDLDRYQEMVKGLSVTVS